MINSAIELLEEELRQAMLASDVEMLDRLIADELMFTAPNGDLVTKEMDLEAHRSGASKFTQIEIIDRQIRDYDGCAVVAVKAELILTYRDLPVSGTYCYTRVWMPHGERWQIVAGHVSQV